MTLDIDATLVEVHSENKQGTAAHDKGGFGFHPLLCFSNTATRSAPCCVPATPPRTASTTTSNRSTRRSADSAAVAAGHRCGDAAPTSPARCGCAPTAGCSVHIAEACGDRNVGFSLVARANDAIDAAIVAALADADRWQAAISLNPPFWLGGGDFGGG